MCGIAGIIHLNAEKVSETVLQKMAEYLAHRGPDGSGTWIEGHVGFAHKRLSIIDLSDNASQPMADLTGSVVITYNGEIYNYKDLKAELTRSGQHFRSQSDTEVILNGYLHWGLNKLLEKLDGMFAFVLYDKNNRAAYACRDRFGKKPLYYFSNGRKFSFASDIRSVWAAEKQLTLDTDSLDYYLTELSVPQPSTIWKEIRQVNPAHYLHLDLTKGKLSELRYWELSFKEKEERLSEQEALEQVEKLLVAAITKRMVGDVPVGCFLSGGADSGLVTALLASHSTKRVKTFTVGVEQMKMNELPLAKKLAERYHTEHSEILVKANVAELLPQLVEEFGEPFADSSFLPAYYISKEIRKHVKVALSGDGGDEIFGGYHEYRTAFLADEYLQLKPTASATILNKMLHRARLSKTNYGHLKKFTQLSGDRKLYREMGFSAEQKQKLYHQDFVHGKFSATARLEKAWQESDQGTITDTLFKASLRTRLLNDYLFKIDRTSMIHALEVRCPFLDLQLAAFAARIPNRIKLKDGTTKFLLKKLAVKYIDRGFFGRTKKGFGVPLKQWLRGEMKGFVSELILSESFSRRKIADAPYVKKILNEHQSGKADHTHRIWALVCLELWFQKFLPS